MFSEELMNSFSLLNICYMSVLHLRDASVNKTVKKSVPPGQNETTNYVRAVYVV